MSGIIVTHTPILPPADAIAIARLHLERLSIMSPEERSVFLQLTTMLINPPMIVGRAEGDAGAHSPQGVAEP